MSSPKPPIATDPAPDAQALVGTVIAGRYKVERLLGEGGMGAVYLVYHTGIRKRMALKVLRADLMRNPAVVARFEREAMAAAHFDHPNVAAAHDYGRIDEGSFYLVLEYVEGQELRAALEQAKGPLPLGRALFIGRQLASALVRAFELGIVHRDLKPENIMLVKRDGHSDFVKVLDFGLAQVSRRIADRPAEDPGTAQSVSAKLTKLGDIFGTPAYMAPEQSVGETTDARTDLYALGVILYELITGQRPFKGKSLLVLVQQHLSAPPPPMSEVAPAITVPKAVEELVQRLLAKSPEDRIQHPQELLDAIDQLVAAHELAWTPGVPSSPPSRGAGAITTGSGAALPAAAGTYIPSLTRALTALRSRVAALLTRKDDQGLLVRLRRRAAALLVRKKRKGVLAQLHSRAAALVGGKKDKSLLARLGRPLPPPLQRVPRWLAATSVALVVALLIGLALKRRPVQAPKTRPPIAIAPTSTPVASPPAETSASQSALDVAGSEGAEALEALARRFPADPRIRRALVRSHISQHRPVEAMRAVAKLAEIDPDTGRDPEIAQALVVALQSEEEATQAAIRLLEQDLGAAGVELLYDLTLKQTGARWKPRLNQSLTKREVLAKATPALRVALELRTAKRCEAKRDLLPRARSEGDRRALVQLKSLTQTQGCGVLGLKDCWPCLRKTPALATTIAALEARTQPPDPSAAKP